MLEYKAARYGRTFARIDRFFPSTRMCSDCGRINDKMALNVRAWACPCGSTHDRDVNAAMNVLAAGRADNSNDRGVRVRPPAMVAPRGETVIHPDAACSTRSVEGISVHQGGENVKARCWTGCPRRLAGLDRPTSAAEPPDHRRTSSRRWRFLTVSATRLSKRHPTPATGARPRPVPSLRPALAGRMVLHSAGQCSPIHHARSRPRARRAGPTTAGRRHRFGRCGGAGLPIPCR